MPLIPITYQINNKIIEDNVNTQIKIKGIEKILLTKKYIIQYI